MSQGSRLRTIALLARPAGLRALKDGLIGDKTYDLLGVLTHGRLPASEDPGRGMRSELADFEETTRGAGIPLHLVDRKKDALHLPILSDGIPVDLLCSVSWRYIVSDEDLGKLRLGGINLHRGRLPDYAGALPVQRALERGDEQGTLTAHLMTPELDGGPILATVDFPLARKSQEDILQATERIKLEILPLYGPLMNKATEVLLGRRGFPKGSSP